jgi:hypothetical protein
MKLRVIALVVTFGLVAGAAGAATATLEIGETANLIHGGQAVLVFVEVECSLDPGEVLLEGNLSVSQDDASGLEGLTPVCDGRRRLYPIRVTSFGGEFDAGEAFASAFLLFLNEQTQQTTSASASRVIQVRGASD